MLPTVSQILDLPVVRSGLPEIVSTVSLDRPVRWVHVSDVADLAHLLQGGELVLTTGQPIVDPGARRGYLTGIASAGAVGLVVELGTHIHSTPYDLGGLADELDISVIVLHRQIRFVSVTEEVHRSIVSEQYAEVAFAREAHEVFTELSMNRASIAEIIDATASIVDGPIVLEDLNRQVLAATPCQHPTHVLLDNWERRSRLTPMTTGTSIEGPESWLTTPVGPHRQRWGRLVAPVTPESPSSQMAMVLERAAQALALHRMVERDRSTLEHQAQSGLVDELRRGRIVDESEASARARALGLSRGSTYTPLTVRVNEMHGADQVSAQRWQASILDTVRHSVRGSRQTALTASSRLGQVDLLLSRQPPGSSDDSLTAVCSRILDALLGLDGVEHCAIGVGPDSERLVDAGTRLSDSSHCADVAMMLPRNGRSFFRTTDIRLRGLLALIRSDPRVQLFAESELRGLLEHRARHGSEIFDLVRAYLDVGGNKTELAARLHLSRPTLYSKLAVAQRLLGVDLDDGESRTSLHTAMLILDTPHSI